MPLRTHINQFNVRFPAAPGSDFDGTGSSGNSSPTFSDNFDAGPRSYPNPMIPKFIMDRISSYHPIQRPVLASPQEDIAGVKAMMEERAQLRTRLQTELMDSKEKHSPFCLASEVLEEFDDGIALSPSEYLDKQLEDMGALESDVLKKLSHVYTFVHTTLKERIAQDALQTFLEEYAPAVRQFVVDNASLPKVASLYHYGPDGLVTTNHGYRELMRLRYNFKGVELELWICLLAIALERNPHSRPIFDGIKMGQDLSNFRTILHASGKEAKDADGGVVYFLSPRWFTGDMLVAAKEGNMDGFEKAGKETPGYIGQTQDPPQRSPVHLEEKKGVPPVSKKVAAGRAEYAPFTAWLMSVLFAMGDRNKPLDPVPVLALLGLEHLSIIFFSNTDSQKGGWNTNLCDLGAWQMLLSSRRVRVALKIIDKILEAHPSWLLPPVVDEMAWMDIGDALFPDGCPIAPSTLSAIIHKKVRTWAARGVETPTLNAYLATARTNSETSGGRIDASASTLHLLDARWGYAMKPSQSPPVALLRRMCTELAQAADEAADEDGSEHSESD